VKPNRATGLLAALGAIACLSGCGSAAPVAGRIHGTTLRIYYSGPTHGNSSLGSEAALNGARMALAGIGGRIGKYRVQLRALDDATPQSDGWDPNQTTIDARLAVQDPTAVGYLGDFNSGAAAISIPLLNREGIAQIGPAASAVGLTSTGPGASPGEPEKYYPTGTRTFARPVSNDAVQALTQVRLAQSSGCRRMFVLHDGEVDGEDEALSFVLTAQSAGLRVVGVQVFQPLVPNYTPLALSVAQTGADCVVLSAIDEQSAARLAVALARALPHAPIIASSGLADSAFTSPADGGLPVAEDARVVITSPTLDARSYPPSGQAFLAAYARQFGPPEPAAIFGYEAMSLLLSAIEKATDHGHKTAERSKVVEAVFATRRRSSVLGTYSIDASGDTTLRRYAIYRIVAGRLSFWRQSG
jgi:branched-chain amino acid transport system substrate-binding protein